MRDQIDLFLVLSFIIILLGACSAPPSTEPQNTFATLNTSTLTKFQDKTLCRKAPYSAINSGEIDQDTWEAIISSGLYDSGSRVGFLKTNQYCEKLKDKQYVDRNGRCHDYLTGRFERCQ